MKICSKIKQGSKYKPFITKSTGLKRRNLSSFASQNFNVEDWSKTSPFDQKNKTLLSHRLDFADQKIFCGVNSIEASLSALLKVYFFLHFLCFSN